MGERREKEAKGVSRFSDRPEGDGAGNEIPLSPDGPDAFGASPIRGSNCGEATDQDKQRGDAESLMGEIDGDSVNCEKNAGQSQKCPSLHERLIVRFGKSKKFSRFRPERNSLCGELIFHGRRTRSQ